MDGFDLLNNEQDRRILYEVLNMRIYRDEFHAEESSNSMGDDTDPLTELDLAIMYGNYDEDIAETGNNALN